VNDTDLPDGYRWATEEECYVLEGGQFPEEVRIVARTVDTLGRPYTEGEADIAVPIDYDMGLEPEEPTPEMLTYKEALDLAIFAINTLMHPDASEPEDIDRLERMSESVVMTLADIREAVVGVDAA